MRGGHVDAISRQSVSGWAADPGRPLERLIVSVAVNGVHLGDVTADRQRADLAKLGRFGDGLHGFTFTFPERLDPERDHHVTVRYTEDGKLLPNGEHRLVSARAAALPTALLGDVLTPILVTAPGRSGTTLLMGLLAASPDIIAAELVPYELRLLSYFSVAQQVLTTSADLEKSTHPDRLEGDGFHIGFNPFNSQQYARAFQQPRIAQDFYDNRVPTRMAECLRDVINEHYRLLAADRGKPAVRYFAEKGNNVVRGPRIFTRRAFGRAREIVILRDPRDVLCSQMAYFSSSPEKAFSQLSHAARQLLSIRQEPQEDIHFIKYEDMVTGEADCFEALSAFLGTKIQPAQGEASLEVFRRHGTSASPAASVARWREQLPPEVKERCAKDWGLFLDTFGYDRS